NVTPRILEQTRLQFPGVASGTHGYHPRTVGGPMVRPAGPWFTHATLLLEASEKLAKGQATPGPMDRRSDYGLWSRGVGRTLRIKPPVTTDG
ncbi:hypothetical protein MTR67_052609, partial [Solanum verrucosum]